MALATLTDNFLGSKLTDSNGILFLSDAHLGGFSDAKNYQIETELIALIEYAENNNFSIAVLGDLFDYWMEYKNYVPPVGKKVLAKFADFSTTHSSLYITGNHDNWTQGYFNKIGFDVEPNYRLLNIEGKRTLLLHGDAIGEDLENLKRPLLHRILRNKNFVKWYKRVLRTPQKGIQVMKKYSRFTNYLTSGKTRPEALDKWSKSMLQNNDIDFIICGHDHVPRVQKYNFGTYINLGTFYHHKTLVIYNNNEFQLVYWNRNKNQLRPFITQY